MTSVLILVANLKGYQESQIRSRYQDTDAYVDRSDHFGQGPLMNDKACSSWGANNNSWGQLRFGMIVFFFCNLAYN